MMFSLDITFCANKNCSLRSTCCRNTDRLKDYPKEDPRLKWISMAGFKQDEDGKCKDYYPMKGKHDTEHTT